MMNSAMKFLISLMIIFCGNPGLLLDMDFVEKPQKENAPI